MRTRQKRVATDTWRSLGCRTTPLEHWSRRKPTVEPRWAKQQTKQLRPKPTKINSFMSGPSLSLQLKVCRQLKYLNPTVVYATDRSKAVVPMLFLFCEALWIILRGASCFKVFPCSLSSCFVIPFSIVITSLGEEGAGLCAPRAFVC